MNRSYIACSLMHDIWHLVIEYNDHEGSKNTIININKNENESISIKKKSEWKNVDRNISYKIIL